MSINKSKTKLSTKDKEQYKKLSDAIGSTVLQLGYNAMQNFALTKSADSYNQKLIELKKNINKKYGSKDIDFKNNKLIY